jgi:hypothetical protein
MKSIANQQNPVPGRLNAFAAWQTGPGADAAL